MIPRGGCLLARVSPAWAFVVFPRRPVRLRALVVIGGLLDVAVVFFVAVVLDVAVVFLVADVLDVDVVRVVFLVADVADVADVAAALGRIVGSACGAVALHPVTSRATPAPRATAVGVVLMICLSSAGVCPESCAAQMRDQ